MAVQEIIEVCEPEEKIFYPGLLKKSPVISINDHFLLISFYYQAFISDKVEGMYSNAALQIEIASGNEEAFKMLFEKHRGKLYNYLFSIVKSKEIAEEIVIDVFMKMWTGRELITDIHNMDAFLHKVAYNKALDFLRIASRNAALQKLVRREMESAKEKEADYKMVEQECQKIIDQALQQLSPRRRKVFTLSRVDGLSYDEIAQKLQLSRSTVRNTMSETLRSIRSFLRKNNINSLIMLSLLLKSQP